MTFLNPENWDDRNDSYFMSLYKRKKKLETLLAVCCSTASETYHHWRVYSQTALAEYALNSSADDLMNVLLSIKGIRAHHVRYLKIKDFMVSATNVSMMPFFKRAPFGPEREFRIIYESKSKRLDSFSSTIPLGCINRIYLSPWMHESLKASVRRVLKSLDGAHSISIFRSTLIQNDDWRQCWRGARRRQKDRLNYCLESQSAVLFGSNRTQVPTRKEGIRPFFACLNTVTGDTFRSAASSFAVRARP